MAISRSSREQARVRGRDARGADDAWVAVYIRVPLDTYRVLAREAQEEATSVGARARAVLVRHARGER